eukprot:TRINITY_DN4005_c0_g3_i1.p1 TRINITY_DN4005_c0_g3~~TRINITY_DN4005_c0_g3_i1.p1  ORF type:complete len:451 (+),score=65.59 TRINITY_DN4005_c0_g3_i1:100-1452(+)
MKNVLLAYLFISLFVVVLCSPRFESVSDQEVIDKLKQNIFFAADGIVNPSSYYQRFRQSEYPSDQPFFQWYYYFIKDLSTNNFWAISYIYDLFPSNATSSGAYPMFLMINSTGQTHFIRIQRYNPSEYVVSGDFNVNIANNQYSINVEDDDTYVLQGAMSGSDFFECSGCEWNFGLNGIKWDLTLNRIYGWYGQSDLETYMRDVGGGEISWNTYAHNCIVSGTITIGENVFTLTNDINFRAYGDMNWGSKFPTSDGKVSSIYYPWTWYNVVIPSNNPYDDISIVSGSGLTYNGFPLYNVFGGFSDIRITNSTHIGVRWLQALVGTDLQFNVIANSNDVKVLAFNVTTSNWQNFTNSENITIWHVPLNQNVTMTTENYNIVLQFTSIENEYNRLPFMDSDYIFSDFEGLGVQVHVSIEYTPTNTLLVDQIVNNAGIEYGYRTFPWLINKRK